MDGTYLRGVLWGPNEIISVKALSTPKIKHYHYCYTSFPSLHNGCVLEKVIMKMYRLNFYYQITEQLHYKIIGKRFLTDWNENLMYGGGSGGGRVCEDSPGSSLSAAALPRSSYLPLLSLPGLSFLNLLQQFPEMSSFFSFHPIKCVCNNNTSPHGPIPHWDRRVRNFL